MRARLLVLLLLISWWPPIAPGQSAGAPSSGGTFVKPPVSVNFKEALTFAEVSLMVRSGLSEAEILQEISQRGLVYPVTEQEAEGLKAKGATPAVLAALRDPRFVLTDAEIQNYQQRQAAKQAGKTETLTTRSFQNSAAPASAPSNVPSPTRKDTEIEVPLDQATQISVNGHPVRIIVHDNGGEDIFLRVNSGRPMVFQKAGGMDIRNDNLTFLFANEGGKVYFVNTPRARMNMCILRIEPR